MSFERVDEHKNINGTKRRQRINSSFKYFPSRPSRYVDSDLKKIRKNDEKNVQNEIQTSQHWEDLIHVQWVHDQEVL